MHPQRKNSHLARRAAASALVLAAVAALGLAACPALVVALPCVQPDASGTVNLPPQGCGYLSPADVHKIIDGLPAGTHINVGIEHHKFFSVTRNPGGSLGGEIENFSSLLVMQMQGVGAPLNGFVRFVTVPVQCETHVAPRTVNDPVQSFDTNMFMLQGQIIGDPDFDLLRITAGTGFGMPSPGHTTLTQQGPSWDVDSFFDITYRIDFIGAPGSVLGGHSGSTTATIRMQAGDHPLATEPSTWGTVKNIYKH